MPTLSRPAMPPLPESPIAVSFRERAATLDPKHDGFAVDLVNLLFEEARSAGASDVHIQPREGGNAFDIHWRLNGVLHTMHRFEAGASHVVGRLKVLAELLTYKSDIPQEGRIRGPSPDVEMRLSTFPTVHGEKAVIRLFVGSGQYRTIDQLGLPQDVRGQLLDVLEATSGVLIVAGPSGSGKTTTLYACLRHLQTSQLHSRSICTLEDPVEALLPGAAQSQIRPAAGFTYASGLKSLLRQDPDVIMVGEIRDAETSQIVFQASLTGRLVLSSFHAGTSAEAISRLGDMGVEPYVLRSGLRAILTQKLVRLLCPCAGEVTQPDDFLGLPVTRAREHQGCERCLQTGYSGRLLLAELVIPTHMELRQAILSRSDAAEIQRMLAAAGVKSVFDRAVEAVQQGRTSPQEVRRVLGAD